MWRKAASGAVTGHQEESLSTTMFLLKELGPTGFLLKEDREPRNYKVRFLYRKTETFLVTVICQFHRVVVIFLFTSL